MTTTTYFYPSPAKQSKRSVLLHRYTRLKPQARDNRDPEEHNSALAPLILTVDEACSALRVSKWTLYQLIRSKQLATIKIGSRRFVPVAAVQMLVERLQAEEEF